MTRIDAATDIRPIALLGAAIGCGAPDERCADAPFALRDGGLADALAEAGRPAAWHAVHLAPKRADGVDPLLAVADLARRLAADSAALTRDGRRFVSFGGDHTAAIGLWSGAARGLRERRADGGRFGLIWVDAHMDAHTFATTESRMIHGMPVACLLGHGDAALSHLAGGAPAVAPQNLCLIGTRSFEAGEAALLARLGVRVIANDEVRRVGFAAALAEARAIASDGTAGYGLSLDVDAFDPAEAPGTGYWEPDGLRADDVAPALRGLAADARFIGLEIAEYNPHKDADGRTARIIERMVKAYALA
jgi:arginase